MVAVATAASRARFGLLQDRYVRVGVFPQREKDLGGGGLPGLGRHRRLRHVRFLLLLFFA